MNRRAKFLGLVVLFAAIICMTETSYGGEVDYRAVFFTLEPVEHPDSAGPLDMKFGFTIKDDFCAGCKCCDEIPVEVIPMNGLQYHGEKLWIAHPDPGKDHSFSTILPITLPPNDTSSLRIVLKFGEKARVPAHVYFVTTGDSVEFWKGPPFKSYWDIPLTEPDTTRYEVKIDLRNPRRLKLIMQFEKEFGPITETADSGFYIIRSTRDAVDMLRREGFKCEYLKEPPPRKPGRPGLKSTSKQPKKQKTRHPHPKPDKKNDGQIWLDCVDGEDEWGRLYANQLIRFILGFANHYGDDVYGIANGFRIYSPDGASWDTTMPETLPTLAWEEAFDSYFGIFYKSLTGSGADSIKFVGITWLGGGLPNGFDDTAIAFAIGPIDPEDIGKTICIDSSYVSGSDNWSWSSSSGDSVWYPTWYGPSCFEITGPGMIYYSGRLRYMDPVPPDTTLESIRGATIYMWDADFFGYQFLDSAVTDNSGYFYIGPVTNHDDNGWAGQDVFFSFYAMNEGTYLTDSLNGPVYMVVSDTTDNIAAGDHVYNKDLTVDESGPFFVVDVLLDGYKRWKLERPDPADHPWGPVQVVLNKGSENARYYPADRYIYLNDSVDNNHRWPNTWNKSTILHEHGHRLSHMLLFFRQGGGSHTIYSLVDLGTASSEGWAHFWSASVMDSCTRVTYWNDFHDSSWVNWENGEFDLVPYTGSANAMGKYNETATAGTFWDIYDEIDDDYSGIVDWGDTTRPHHPDDISDTLSNDIDNILIALLDSAALGHRPDNIDEFWEAWFSYPSPGHGQAMQDIWYEHGEIMHCCNGDGIRGNADGITGMGGAIDVADLTYLVKYLFKSGPPPPCEEEGDADASGSIDVADLTCLANYLFKGGSPPANCP